MIDLNDLVEQIVAGLHNRSETELYTKRILTELVSKLRWHFWHANAGKAWDKLRRILTLCRIVVPETAAFRNRLVDCPGNGIRLKLGGWMPCPKS